MINGSRQRFLSAPDQAGVKWILCPTFCSRVELPLHALARLASPTMHCQHPELEVARAALDYTLVGENMK